MLAALLPAILLAGCWGSVCVGADCEDPGNGSRVSLFLGLSGGWGPELDPLVDEDSALGGGESLGTGWQVELGTDTLLVGMPKVGQVLRFDAMDLQRPSTTRYSGAWSSEDPDTAAGGALSLAPDLTGDGRPDLLVGAPHAPGYDAQDQGGKVFLLSDVLAWTGDGILEEESLLTIAGSAPQDRLGTEVATCGDMDKDGVSDWAVAAPWDESGGSNLGGSVTVVLSSRTRALDPDLARSGVSPSEAGPRFTSAVLGGMAGSSLACRDDLTGDGVPDLLVGGPFVDNPREEHEAAGVAYVIDVTSWPEGGDLAQAARWKLRGSNPETYAGSAVASGDLDQDGTPEVLSGAPGAQEAEGRALLYSGLASEKANVYADFGFQGADTGDRLGARAALEDVTGDGHLDVVVGAPHHNPEGRTRTEASGAIYVWNGPRSLISWDKSRNANNANTVFRGTEPWLLTGQEWAVGDLDGDGISDLAMVHHTQN